MQSKSLSKRTKSHFLIDLKPSQIVYVKCCIGLKITHENVRQNVNENLECKVSFWEVFAYFFSNWERG